MSSTTLPRLDRFTPPAPRRKQPYFADYRKGEVGELRLLLRKMLLDSKTPSTTEKLVSQIVDPNVDHFKAQTTKKRRDILKKLIGCMTMGIDLSSLYTDVVMISQTDDPVQKKMIYLYLSNYSANNPDLAILAINTLLKDVDSLDPVIRSLALRNLSSFGTNLANEYATVATLKKMFDPSDSVKRTAIIGSIRIFKSNAASQGRAQATADDLLQDLKMALRSPNIHVVVDAMCAVSEIAEYHGKIPLSTPTVIYLTNSMDEWEQCRLLEVLWTYKPASRDEMFDLMNLLDDRLKHASAAVFLATAKCFLMWTRDDAALQLEVVKRLEEPFVSLINRSRNEIAHTLLANALSLILLRERAEGPDEAEHELPFLAHVDAFFCHYDDPAYIKDLKLDILVAVCTEENFRTVAQELNEYVSDSNHTIANKAVTALGIVALKLPEHAGYLIQQIADIYNFKLTHLSPALLHVIRTLLVAYPGHAGELVEIVKEPSSHIACPAAKAHHIAILGGPGVTAGDHGHGLDHAPYTLEDYVDDPGRTDLMTRELLPATVKMFLKRPGEMRPGLARLLEGVSSAHAQALAADNPDIRLAADFYCGLLKLGREEAAKAVFEDPEARVEADTGALLGQAARFSPDPEWREHFNTVYLVDACRRFHASNNPVFFPFEHSDVATDIFRDEGSRSGAGGHAPERAEPPTPLEEPELGAAGVALTHNALLEELENELKYFNLTIPSTLMSEEFQKAWLENEHAYVSEMEARPCEVNLEELEEVFAGLNMITLVGSADAQASGTNKNLTKLYMYSEDRDGRVYYVELVVNAREGEQSVRATVKSSGAGGNEAAAQSLAEILCDFVNRWPHG